MPVGTVSPTPASPEADTFAADWRKLHADLYAWSGREIARVRAAPPAARRSSRVR